MHKHWKVIGIASVLAIVAIASGSGTESGTQVTLFDKSGSGANVTVGQVNCATVSPFWNDLAFSVQVLTGCVIIFGESNCVGSNIQLCQSDEQYVLHEMDFDEKLSSIRACNSEGVEKCYV